MKILLVNYLETTSPGGINKVIREIAKNLAKRGHQVTVLQPNPSNLKSEDCCDGFKIIRISSQSNKYFYGLNWGIYQYLNKHLKDLNPDIVHVHGYHSLLSVEIINLITRIDNTIPIIFSPHLDIVKSTFAGKYLWNIYNFFARGIFKQSNSIISCSKFEAQNIALLGVDPDKVSVICHGVDSIRHLDNDKISFKDDQINLLYSGYLVSRKGVDFLLDSLNTLVHDMGYEDIVLTIIGDGPEKENLLKLTNKLKLEDYIIWKSFLPREDLIKEIIQSDIFMLLSRSEAYGITVAESLALGTPCIITNRTALKEFNEEPGCFAVDYPPMPSEVAKLILNIKDSDVTIRPLTNKIRTWDEVAVDYERLYETFML
jgi:glycosyltransferase involved in cell wall biosynthesis